MLLVAVVASLATTATAQAQTTPLWGPGYEALQANQQALENWYRAGGPINTANSCGPPVCSKVYLEEHRPIPNQPTSKQLHRELRKLRIRGNVMPTIRSMVTNATGSTAGRLALAAKTTAAAGGAWIAFQVGAWGGNTLYGKYVSWRTPPAPAGAGQWSETDNISLYLPQANPDGSPSVPSACRNRGTQPPVAYCTADGETFFYENESKPSSSYYRQHQVLDRNLPDGYNGYCNEEPLDAPLTVPMASVHIVTTPGFCQTYPSPLGQSSYPEDAAAYSFPWDAGAPMTPGNASSTRPDRDNDGTPDPVIGFPAPAPAPDTIVPLRDALDGCGPNTAYRTLCDWLRHQVDESFPNPVWPKVPACRGMTVTSCTAALDELDIPVKAGGAVVLTPEQADLELPAGAVVETNPETGTSVDPDGDVEVEIRANPDPLPVEVFAPLPQETYPEYVARLRAKGWVGEATRTDVPAEGVVEAQGPEGVVQTRPKTGSRVQPGDPIEVFVNPPWVAPPPDTGSGSCEPWARPDLDLNPLKVPVTQTFPFGAPFWLKALLDKWAGSPKVPEWTFRFPFGGDFTVNLALFDPHMPAIRAVVLIVATVSLLWFFVALAYGQVAGTGRRAETD